MEAPTPNDTPRKEGRSAEGELQTSTPNVQLSTPNDRANAWELGIGSWELTGEMA